MDSSEEELGSEDIDGGVDEVEDRIAEDCGVVFAEDCRTVVVEDGKAHSHVTDDSRSARGELKNCSMPGELHMNIFVRSVIDKRRIESSLHVHPCKSLNSQVVDKLCDQSDLFSRSAEPS